MARIDYDVVDHVATIVINNPDKRNAVTKDMYHQLEEAYDHIVRDEDVRVAVITGAGERAFSTGASITGYLADGVLGEDAQQQRAGIPKPWRIYKPIIAAIEGYAVGGGFGLALYCDLRVVTTSSTLGPSSVKRGVVSGATQATMLTRVVGLSNAVEVHTMSKWIDGAEAYRLGLAQRLVAPGEALSTALGMAHRICTFSPNAVQGTKRLAYDSADLPLEEALEWEMAVSERSFRTADALEGFTAFAEKREPRWGRQPLLESLGFDEYWPRGTPPVWRS